MERAEALLPIHSVSTLAWHEQHTVASLPDVTHENTDEGQSKNLVLFSGLRQILT